uniref:Purinergic receptor P2Y14 n=1 Tax=Gopherus evgoodei TaxID=1825980 RepID=A0A8C4Y1R8_9SAUR
SALIKPHGLCSKSCSQYLAQVTGVGGILLNGVAAWIFLHVPSKKSFVVYLKNIVVADLLMSLTLPFKILNDSEIGPWQINVLVCRFSAVIFYLNMYVGITFFGLIGFDRYYKIVKPLLTSFVHTVNYSKITSVVVWALLIEEFQKVCTLKSELVYSQTGSQFSCQSSKNLYYAKEFTLLLSAANVCLDPIIYLFLCKPFREKLYQKLHLKLTTLGEIENSKSRRSNIT